MALTTLPTRGSGDLGAALSDVRAPEPNELSAVNLERIKDRVIELGTDVGVDASPAAGSIKARLNALESVSPAPSGDNVIWEWNRTGTTQFDGTAVASSGQALALTYQAPSIADKRPSPLLVATATWVGGGGAAAIRVAPAEGLVLPSRFRVRADLRNFNANVSLGFLFYQGSTWGAGLIGCGTGFYGNSTSANWINARAGVGGTAPFDLPVTTPTFISIGTRDEYGIQVELDVEILQGTVSDSPEISLYGRGNGGGVGGYRGGGGELFTGTTNTDPPVVFDDAQINSFALVARSVSGTGAFAAKIAALQILDLT